MRQSPQTMSLKSLRESGERDRRVKVKRVEKNVQAVSLGEFDWIEIGDIPSFCQLARQLGESKGQAGHQILPGSTLYTLLKLI